MQVDITVMLDRHIDSEGYMQESIQATTGIINNKNLIMPTRGDFLNVLDKNGKNIYGLVYMIDHKITNKVQTLIIHLTDAHIPG